MSLHVLAYNAKRLMSLLGVAGMIKALRAYALLLTMQCDFGTITLLIGQYPQTAALLPEYLEGSHHRHRRIQFHYQSLLLGFYTTWVVPVFLISDYSLEARVWQVAFLLHKSWHLCFNERAGTTQGWTLYSPGVRVV
jgi:hypothetical protein